MKLTLIVLFLVCLQAQGQSYQYGQTVKFSSSGAFDPTSVSALAIWFNPTNGPDTNLNNGAITYWTNSLNSRLATPLVMKFSSGVKMQYKTSGALNGQAGVFSAGAFMPADTGPSTNWAQPVWMWAVVQSTNAASNSDTYQVPFTGGSSARLLVTNGYYAMMSGATTVIQGHYNYTNRAVLLTCCFSNNTSYLYTNGVLDVSGNAGSGTIGNNFILGADASSTLVWRGFLGDIMVASSNITPAQVTSINNYLIARYNLPDTTTHPISELVTSATVAGPRNNFSGHVGFFFIPKQDLYVTDLGRWVISGNSGTHTGVIYNSTPTLLGSVSINTSGATAGQFKYATLSSVVMLKGGFGYILESNETSGGDQWYDCPSTAPTFSADASGNPQGGTIAAAAEVQQNVCAGQPLSPGNCYGLPSLKYWTP